MDQIGMKLAITFAIFTVCSFVFYVFLFEAEAIWGFKLSKCKSVVAFLIVVNAIMFVGSLIVWVWCG